MAAQYQGGKRRKRTTMAQLRGGPERASQPAPQAAKLGMSADLPRLSNRAMTPKEGPRPSERLAARQKEKEKGKSLGESLTEAAAMFPEGRGAVGRALKAGMSGAAAGATLGEALAKLQAEKAQRGKPLEPKAMSEKVMAGHTSVGDAQAAFTSPESQEQFRKRMKELRDGRRP